MPVSLHDVSDAEALPFDNNEERTSAHSGATDDDFRTPISDKIETSENGDGDGTTIPPLKIEIQEDLETPQEKKHHTPSSPPPSISESSSGDGMSVGEEDQKTAEPEIENNNGSDNRCECSLVAVSVESLPPLIEPKHAIIREETSRGLCTVITAVLLSVFLTHYISLTLILPSVHDGSSAGDFESDEGIEDGLASSPYKVGRTVFLALIYTESALALACMVGILYADPCVVKRSEETCNPLPLVVESWLLSGGESTTTTPYRPRGLERYVQGPDRRIYCTKCLLWRSTKKGVSNFHCAICQRCCAYHDHHCNVFGRCIAGNPRFWEKGSGNSSGSGNLLYFYGILLVGALVFFTIFSALLYAFSMRYETKYAVPIGLLVMLLASCCCFDNGPIQIICWPACRLMKKFLRQRPGGRRW